MNVGMVGLGKLGLPVAYAMAARGLNVYGYDPAVKGPPEDTSHEQGLAETIRAAEGRMRFVPLHEVVGNCDVIFVAVQTPHEPRFEGVTPLPEDRADFDYSHLKYAISSTEAAAFALNRHKDITVAVISTVLPGTMAREIRALSMAPRKLVYSPSFIAMGTTIQDFLDPEFVLLGGDDGTVENVYREMHYWPPKIVRTTVENAELIKVAYNTFIGLKIAFANTLMEVCHKTGCDVDEVTGALKQADRRLISGAYLDGGMGDGGGCHPRDNIALSWLARELDLSHDLFEDAMTCREDQARWLVDLMEDHPLHKGILGVAYKPGSHITTGSSALLVVEMLRERCWAPEVYDPHISARHHRHLKLLDERTWSVPRVWLVGCKHPEFVDLKLTAGSVVIDPFRYMPDQEGVEVIHVGSGQRAAADHGQTGDGPALRSAAA